LKIILKFIFLNLFTIMWGISSFNFEQKSFLILAFFVLISPLTEYHSRFKGFLGFFSATFYCLGI
jgi:hypothetical protein